jgi:hypothetical protein
MRRWPFNARSGTPLSRGWSKNWTSAPPAASGTGLAVQRMAEWKRTNHPDIYLDTFANTLNSVVQQAATVALDPESLPDLDGYITLWKDTAILVKAIVQDAIDKDDEDAVAEAKAALAVAPARYGYAVEALACGEARR